MKKIAAALIVLALLAVRAVAGDVRPIVVEVYTSQGCNSCPAANMMAAKIAQRPGILLLSFPVTYWDMFGWKDTLASDDNTRRQKAYASALRHGGVYTPQMIIDGAKDVPAAREDAVSYALTLAAMARDDGMQPDVAMPPNTRRDKLAGDVAFVAASRIKIPARSAWSVGVALAKRPGDLHVVVDRVPDVARRSNVDATVWLFRVRSAATVKIGGGENSGQTVAYRNVVTSITNAGRWRGEPLTIDVPKAGPKGPVHDAVAVVVQQGGSGRVVGAALVGNAPFYAPW
jgi:hypothetical protein